MEEKRIIETQEEQMLNKAAYELSDEKWDIMDNLKKAQLLMGDIIGEYFEIHDSKKIEDGRKILYDYSRYGIYARIVDDYIYEVIKYVEVLEQRSITHMQMKEEIEDKIA